MDVAFRWLCGTDVANTSAAWIVSCLAVAGLTGASALYLILCVRARHDRALQRLKLRSALALIALTLAAVFHAVAVKWPAYRLGVVLHVFSAITVARAGMCLPMVMRRGVPESVSDIRALRESLQHLIGGLSCKVDALEAQQSDPARQALIQLIGSLGDELRQPGEADEQ